MLPARRVLLPLLLAAASLLTGCRDKHDVVLITIDTLRVDHVGAHDTASPAATPHMDALAGDGVVYTDAWSPISVTGPAFVTLHTARHPGTHGVVMNLFRGGPELDAETPTLARRLKRKGYRTGAFVSGFTLRRKLGLDRGFQAYDAPPADMRRRPGDQTADLALSWLAEQPGKEPVLLWYHSYDPHGPLTPYDAAAPISDAWERDPEKLQHLPAYQRIGTITDAEFYEKRYAAAVTFADEQVGRIVAALKEQGRYDDAMIVVTSDHGETFTERPLWFDHGTHASAEQLHVPLIVKYPDDEAPDGLAPGGRYDRLVTLADIAPEILRVLGRKNLAGADGVPLSQARHTQVTGESSHCKKAAVLECRPRGPGGKEFAVRTAEQSVLRGARKDGPVYELYDRTVDAAERAPLDAASAPVPLRAVVDAMAADRTARDLATPGAGGDADDAGDDPEAARELEALRALGYVDE